MKSRWVQFVRDLRGAEVTELAMVLALIVAGAVAGIGLCGVKIQQYYGSFNSVLP